MKKRLLISSVLMSAVLACALGTGTYAWYSATGNAANISAGATIKGDVSLTAPELTASDHGFSIAASMEEVADTKEKDLLLAAYESSAWVSKYNVTGGTRTYTPKSDETYYRVYKVSVTGSYDGDDETEFKAMTHSKTYTITFASGTAQVDPDGVPASDDEWTPTQAASFWTQGTSAVTAPDDETTLSCSVDTLVAAVGYSMDIGYLVVYVDGTANEGTHTGTVRVHVSSTANVA